MSSSPKVLTADEIQKAIPTALQIGQAHFVGQVLNGVVLLGVPDAIGSGSLTTAEIAARVGTDNIDGLHRALRFLAAASGIFLESSNAAGECTFALTEVGALFQERAPRQPSMACGVKHWLEKPNWNAWALLPEALAGKLNNDPFTAANGAHVFDFFASHPESAAPFNEFMTFFSNAEIPVVTDMFDWSPFEGKTVVDVGGSYGPVMAALKAKHPTIRTISFDLPEVIDAINEAPAGVEFVKGDMFDAQTIPKVDGAIFMKHILHDWSDENCEKILKSCWTALEPGAKVLIADAVLPAAGEQTPIKSAQLHLDILMSIYGGKERTLAQWTKLASATGFAIESVLAAPVPNCQIITLVKA